MSNTDSRRLSQRVLSIAENRPNNVAIATDNSQSTYEMLSRGVDVLAHKMRAQGIGAGHLVAFICPPGIEMVQLIIAILETGAAYLSLDPLGPHQRNYDIIADAQPIALITDDPHHVEAVHGTEAAHIRIGSLYLSILEGAPRQLPPQTAYVIYTSGTTGSPKGVPISHRNVFALFDAVAPWFNFTPSDRWLLFHTTAFDFSVWELWGALLNGARVVVPDRWTIRDPCRCADFIRDQRITILNQTPTSFQQLLPELLSDPPLTALRYLVLGGERLLPKFLDEFFDTQDVTIYNMYGITETTVHSTIHRITVEDIHNNRSVVGQPLAGFSFKLVDENGNETDDGELWLAGPQVSNGYLDRPDLTAEKFRARDGVVYYRSGDRLIVSADNELIYVGRLDEQVKIRGHRIELGEIDSFLFVVPGVKSATTLRISGSNGDEIACAYTTEASRAVPRRIWISHLRPYLPDYMIPSLFVHLDEIPRTPNGKADRRAIIHLLRNGQ